MSDKQAVFSLAEQRSFDDLSLAEQDLVLQEMSKFDFDELHQNIQKNREFFEAQIVEVNPAVKTNLDQAFRAKHETKKTFWIRHSIPLWQAMAACFLVAIISWAFLQPDTTEKNTETIYVYQTDTIFQDAPIVNEKPQSPPPQVIQKRQKESSIVVKQNQKPSDTVAAMYVANDLERLPKLEDSIIVFRSKTGQSVKDDTLLMNWGGVIF